MLREFLSKIFSPPKPYEEPRVQRDDFARLKKRIREEETAEPAEICETPHGSLSELYTQHTPLSRSVSMGASTAAYERYLQRNAARADNWSEFDDILHPKIEPEDANAKPASFLSQEEQELLAQPQVSRPNPIEPFLQPQETSSSDRVITPTLVHAVEMIVTKNALKQLSSSKTKIKLDTLQSFKKKPKTNIGTKLSQRVLMGWLVRHARLSETPVDALRVMSQSIMPDVRQALASNDRIPFECLWSLAHDPEAQVRLTLTRNPNCSIELLETLSKDDDKDVAQCAEKILTGIIG